MGSGQGSGLEARSTWTGVTAPSSTGLKLSGLEKGMGDEERCGLRVRNIFPPPMETWVQRNASLL